MRSGDTNGASMRRVYGALTRMYAAHTRIIATPAQDIDTPLVTNAKLMLCVPYQFAQTRKPTQFLRYTLSFNNCGYTSSVYVLLCKEM